MDIRIRAYSNPFQVAVTHHQEHGLQLLWLGCVACTYDVNEQFQQSTFETILVLFYGRILWLLPTTVMVLQKLRV